MNLTRLILLICIFLSPIMGAAAEKPDTPSSAASAGSNTATTRVKKRPPALNYPAGFGQKREGASTRGQPTTVSIPPAAADGENVAPLSELNETKKVVELQCTCVGCTWGQHSPEVQQGWIQSELRRLVDANNTYKDLNNWAYTIWHYANFTSKFLITAQMFDAWKLHIGSREPLAPEWMAEFLAHFVSDSSQPQEHKIRANEILGEISKISKKFAMEDSGGALPSSEVPQSVTASAATHTNFTTPIPQPRSVKQPSIYSYTLETAYTAVVEMENLSKQSRARDQYAFQTLLHIAENQAVDLNIRAAAYIVLGNGKYGTDMGVECYEKALKLNPSKIIKAKAHLGLAKAHIAVVINCQTAIILAIENKAITEKAYITWGNALASPDYGNNNIQALLMYFKAKEASYRSVKVRSYYILQDLKLYDSYCSIGEAGFSKNTSHASKINQLNLSPQDAAELLQARQFFQM